MKLFKAAQFLEYGLALDGQDGIHFTSKKRKEHQFRALYGATSLSCEAIWSDLHTNENPDIFI
eukprot:14917544-Ditylum_brightwellii.AAC.1